MKWEAPSLAHFATDAGFPRSILAGVVACALATSGGHDNYELTAGVPGSGHWKGLWGLNVDRWAEYAELDLYDPRAAAAAAYRLTARTSSLRWCPAFDSGQWKGYVPHVTGQLSFAPFGEAQHDPVTVVVHGAFGANDPTRLQRVSNG